MIVGPGVTIGSCDELLSNIDDSIELICAGSCVILSPAKGAESVVDPAAVVLSTPYSTLWSNAESTPAAETVMLADCFRKQLPNSLVSVA